MEPPFVEYVVREPSHLQTVGDPSVAVLPDNSAWVAWRVDDVHGPEGGVRARRIGPQGEDLTGEIIVARGTRGGFALGNIVALEGGGCAIAWRGEEGLAWVGMYYPTGRLRRVRFLEPCEEAPIVAYHPCTGELAVALVRTEGGGAVAYALVDEDGTRPLLQGIAGSTSAVIAFGRRGYGLACRTERALHIVDALERTVIEPPTPRTIAHAPTLSCCDDGWACAWIGEDTGRLIMYVARVGGRSVKVAEVWAPIDRPEASAPALCERNEGGLLLAWREERGPQPAVYLRPLDRNGHRDGSEVRVSTRGAVAMPGKVGLAALPERQWVCAYAERRAEGHGVWIKRGKMR